MSHIQHDGVTDSGPPRYLHKRRRDENRRRGDDDNDDDGDEGNLNAMMSRSQSESNQTPLGPSRLRSHHGRSHHHHQRTHRLTCTEWNKRLAIYTMSPSSRPGTGTQPWAVDEKRAGYAAVSSRFSSSFAEASLSVFMTCSRRFFEQERIYCFGRLSPHDKLTVTDDLSAQ